jgi:hypothetical protein
VAPRASATTQTAVIAQPETSGALPGAPQVGTPPTAGQRFVTRASLRQEYVAGGVGGAGQWFTNLARTLPFAVDDVTADFGDDLYERMLLDPQLAALVTILKSAILEEGLDLAPAVDDADQDGYAQAVAICEAATAMLSNLAQPLDEALWDLLDCVALGNRVAELVYDYDRTYAGTTQLALIAVHPKPRRVLSFVVDAYYHILGFLALIPGQGSPVLQSLVLDPAHQPNLLPREKFAVLSFRTRNSDPRGTSILRPAYNVWQLKQQALMEHLKYLAQFASPSLIGFTPPDAELLTQTDALGNPQYDASGTLLPAQTPEQAMQAALAQFKNGTAAAFRGDAKVQLIQSQGEGHAFLAAFDYYDKQMTKAVLAQTLATEEGQHQARAAAQTHQDILDTIIRQAKRAVERTLVRDILRPWVRYNYGDAALPLLPRATLGTTEQQDIAVMRTSVAALVQAGYDISPSQYPDLDQQLDLPARSADDQARLEAEAVAPPPVPPVVTLPGQQPPAPPQRNQQPPAKEEAAA